MYITMFVDLKLCVSSPYEPRPIASQTYVHLFHLCDIVDCVNQDPYGVSSLFASVVGIPRYLSM
jgi:hypothetical protein